MSSKKTLKIPSLKGVYLIVTYLDSDTQLDIASLGRFKLRKGYYIYAGSAKGPGGLKARIRRHLRKEKKKHWHIDYLLEKTKVKIIAYNISSTVSECELVAKLVNKGIQPVITGFGASDCKGKCLSHLLYVYDLRELLKHIMKLNIKLKIIHI